MRPAKKRGQQRSQEEIACKLRSSLSMTLEACRDRVWSGAGPGIGAGSQSAARPMEAPPSTNSVWPVMNAASSDIRKMILITGDVTELADQDP